MDIYTCNILEYLISPHIIFFFIIIILSLYDASIYGSYVRERVCLSAQLIYILIEIGCDSFGDNMKYDDMYISYQ